MSFPIHKLAPNDFPDLLHEIPDPPEQLYLRGALHHPDAKLLCVIGSRKYTRYGKDACEKLIGGLSGYPVSIVSGLALGMDAIAHRAALAAGIHTIAIPGSGIDDAVLYPRTNAGLGTEILKKGGALLSEYEPTFKAQKWSFTKRNRIMAGMCHAVLIIEGSDRSGSLVTTRLATDYNRDVLAVPGSIFSSTSYGPHMLIRLGATPITSSEGIIESLGLEAAPTSSNLALLHLTKEEQLILTLLDEPQSRDELLQRTSLNIAQLQAKLLSLELSGAIVESDGMIRRN